MVVTGIKKILFFTAAVFVVSLGYFLYVYSQYSPIPERETILSEIGDGFGEIGLWALLFIYARTLLKLIMGKGRLARRLLPDYSSPDVFLSLQGMLCWLDKTHVYVGISAVAVILLHIGMMGVPMEILFFPAVLILVIWQGLFGLFLTWRYSPKELKKFSYLVHAQFVTGIMIGIFAYFGHLLIDD